MQQQQEMATFNDLPAELKLHILSYVGADDVSSCRSVSKHLNNLILHFPFSLQRVRCCAEVISDRSKQQLIIRIQKTGSSKIIELSQNNYDILKRIEISSLRVNICEDGNAEIYSDDKILQLLINILVESKQTSLRIVTVKGLQIDNAELAHNFLHLISTAYLQELNLSNSISKFLVPEHVCKMQSICQIRLEPTTTITSTSIAASDAIITKIAHDMRHKPRINIPFVAEVDLATPQTVFSFIQEWIFLPETPYFQIKLSNFTSAWLETFNDLCENQNIRHVFYEFSSKINHHAHIKIKFHENSNECMIFAVRDVPARSLANPYICYARYCRDF